jgi:hypothetical protein
VCYILYTSAIIIDNERAETLRDGLLRLCIELRSFDGPIDIVRTDLEPEFCTLIGDMLIKEAPRHD